MKVFGIVAEYNPFHKGHEFLISRAREEGATHIAAVMSGDFVQRGQPAFMGKFERAAAAADCGVDLVIELPVQYSLASSERFAAGAVGLLDSLGMVDSIIFGSECADAGLLQSACDAVCDERIAIRTRELCESGVCYPAAQSAAVSELFPAAAPALCAPNDILGVDYLKALKKLGSGIVPVPVARKGAAHDAREPRSGYAGAAAIRAMAAAGEEFERYLPTRARERTAQAVRSGSVCFGFEKIERLLLYTLRSMSREQLLGAPDTGGGLGERIYAASRESKSAAELFEKAKTRRYTMSRVKRAVCCAMLGIGAEHCFAPPYVRVLAIGRRGAELLGEMKASCALPVSHSLRVLALTGENAALTAQLTHRASELYALSTQSPANAGAEYTTKLYKRETE